MYPLTTAIQHKLYAENIMREALEEWERGISIGGRMVTYLRYADDITLLAGTKEDLVELVGRVRRASEKAGLYLNVGKTKVMTTGDIGEVTVDGKDIEVVTKFVFLGALLLESLHDSRPMLGAGSSSGVELFQVFMGTGLWQDGADQQVFHGLFIPTFAHCLSILVESPFLHKGFASSSPCPEAI